MNAHKPNHNFWSLSHYSFYLFFFFIIVYCGMSCSTFAFKLIYFSTLKKSERVRDHAEPSDLVFLFSFPMLCSICAHWCLTIHRIGGVCSVTKFTFSLSLCGQLQNSPIIKKRDCYFNIVEPTFLLSLQFFGSETICIAAKDPDICQLLKELFE